MCDPVSATIAGIASAGASLYGTMASASAAKSSAASVAAQNRATKQAQNEGFGTRLAAGLRQVGDQRTASETTIASRDAAASNMRDRQSKALDDYKAVLDAENTQAESLRATGDAAAQDLLADTTGAKLTGAQDDWKTQAAALLNTGEAGNTLPAATDPGGSGTSTSTDAGTTDENNAPGAAAGDEVAQGALARRTAEAASNVRGYGAKVAQVGSYAAPINTVALADAANKAQIMPAQKADELLRSGSAARLLPAHVEYTAATGLGGAMDDLLKSRGQAALDSAALSYGNATDIANLTQANSETTAKNTGAQKEADAAYAKTQGGILSGLGNLGLYGTGYFGGDSLKTSLKSLFV